MPALPAHVLPNLVVLLGVLQDLHVQFHNRHALLRAQLPQGPLERHRDLAQPGIAARLPPAAARRRRGRSPRVGEDDGARVLERAGDQRALEEQRLGARVVGQPGGAGVAQRPEGRDDDDLGAGGDELAEGLGEGEVPADQQADAAERRVEGAVWRVGGGAGQVRALGVPEVLLLVGGQERAGARDEVRDVDQAAVRALLDDGPRHEVDGELLG